MKIPDTVLDKFRSDLNRAMVSNNPGRRVETVVTIYVATARDALRIAWGGPKEVAVRAELERIAEEAESACASHVPDED